MKIFNNPVVSKNELIDILYKNRISNNSNLKEYITKADINDIINRLDSNKELLNFEDELQQYLLNKNIDIVKVFEILGNYYNQDYFYRRNDKYIYICNKSGNDKDFVKQIEYILNHDLNNENNRDYLNNLKNQYQQVVSYEELSRKNLPTPKDRFKNYDYIKIINENAYYNDIRIKDIEKCEEFLNYHENVEKYLTIEQQILLRYIILCGVKNEYTFNFDYFKNKYNLVIDSAINNIYDYIEFIKVNLSNVKDEYLYPKDSLSPYKTNIRQQIAPIFEIKEEWWEKPAYKFYDKYAQIQFISLLKYISFVYYVSDIKFETEKLKETIKKFENEIKIKELKKEKNHYDAEDSFRYKDVMKEIYYSINRFENIIQEKGFEEDICKEIRYGLDKAKYELENDNYEKVIDYVKKAINIFETELKEIRLNKAKKIYETKLPLFSFFKEDSEWSKHSELLLYKLLSDINISVLLFSNNEGLTYDIINNIYVNPKTKNNIKVLLRFYISCYYYFRKINDKKNMNKVAQFLLYFKDGFDIEDFIIYYEYDRMIDKINNLKLGDEYKDDIESTINRINEEIIKMKLVNSFDIEDVVRKYEDIKFNNFGSENREKIKTYIATGDKIFKTFKSDTNMNFDYSSVVIEWSKAVELEINEKLISVLNNNDKYKIEAYSKKINNRDSYKNEHPFVLYLKDATLGTFKAIKDYGLQDYLYNEYYSNIYTIDKETYNDLCKYLNEIVEPRNDSAHKDKPIDLDTASTCQFKILKRQQILEILSKLEKK